MAASPLSSPSESPLLSSAFEDTTRDEGYPSRGQSFPEPRSSASYMELGQSNGTAALPSDPGHIIAKLNVTSRDEERRNGLFTGAEGRRMDPFTVSELLVISCSSLMVAGLICVATLITAGKLLL